MRDAITAVPLLIALLLAGPLADAAAAQEAPVLRPLVLTLPASTRGLALGNTFVAVADDPDAVFYNPALLASAEGIGLSAQRYGDAGGLGAFSAAAELGPGTLAAGARVLDYSADLVPPSATVAAGDTPAVTLYRDGASAASSLAVTLGYGISFDDPSPTWLDDVRVGVSAHALQETAGDWRDTGYGFDVGAAVELEWLMIGLAARNLGPEIAVYGWSMPLPRRLELILAHESRRLGPLDLITAATVSAWDDDDRSIAPGVGVEVSYWPIIGRTFFARIGARHDPDGVMSPLTVGAGFEADAFAIDYAFARAGDEGDAHRVGLRWWPDRR